MTKKKFSKDMIMMTSKDVHEIYFDCLGGYLELRALSKKDISILSAVAYKLLSTNPDILNGDLKESDINLIQFFEEGLDINVHTIHLSTNKEFSIEEINEFPIGSHSIIVEEINRITGNDKGVIAEAKNFRV